MKIATAAPARHVVELKRPNKRGTARIEVELLTTHLGRPSFSVHVAFRGYKKHEFTFSVDRYREGKKGEEIVESLKIVTREEIESAVLDYWQKLGAFEVPRACPNDTDGDGDCVRCHRLAGGCEEFRREFPS
jgi:hypothetical protein